MRSVGPDPDERSAPPDPDHQFERHREQRERRARQATDSRGLGWDLGPRLRRMTTGRLPVVATRDRIDTYRARHYGWKGQATTAWDKLANPDRFATTPSRMDFVTDVPGAALRAAYYGLVWNLLAVMFMIRFGVGRTWERLTLVVDGLEWLLGQGARGLGGVRRVCRRLWNASLGRVVDDD